MLLDAFKTVKPAEKEQAKAPSALGTHGGKESNVVKSAVDQAKEKKERQLALK